MASPWIFFPGIIFRPLGWFPTAVYTAFKRHMHRVLCSWWSVVNLGWPSLIGRSLKITLTVPLKRKFKLSHNSHGSFRGTPCIYKQENSCLAWYSSWMRVLSPPGAGSSLQTLRPGIDGSTRARQAHSVQTEYAKANLQSEEVVELRRINSTTYLVFDPVHKITDWTDSRYRISHKGWDCKDGRKLFKWDDPRAKINILPKI